MMIKTVKSKDGMNRIMFSGDEGKNLRLLLDQAELKTLRGMLDRLYKANPLPLDTVIDQEETTIGIYGFRQAV